MKIRSDAMHILFLVWVLLFLNMTGCSREPQKKETPKLPVTRNEGWSSEGMSPSALNKEKAEKHPDLGAADGFEGSKSNVLAIISENEKPVSSPLPSGHGVLTSMTVQQQSFYIIFSEQGQGVAYTAQKDGKSYVVYNGRPGIPYQGIGAVVLSPDGQRVAYAAMKEGKWRIVIDGIEGAPFDEVREPVFSRDSKHVLYEAVSDERDLIVVDRKSKVVIPLHHSRPLFAGDSRKVIYGDQNPEKALASMIISNLDFGGQRVISDAVYKFVGNKENNRFAVVVVSDGRKKVLEFDIDRPDSLKQGPLYDDISSLSMGSGAASTAYATEKDGRHLLVLDGIEEPFSGGDITGPLVIRPDKKAVGFIMSEENVSYLYQGFLQEHVSGQKYDEASDLVYSGDSRHYAFSARKGNNWFAVVDGKEGPAFDRVVTPVFSPNGKNLVYRARKDGKRFIVVAATNGKTLKQHPAYEQVFQPVFALDGTSVAYGVKDGRKLIWKVERL